MLEVFSNFMISPILKIFFGQAFKWEQVKILYSMGRAGAQRAVQRIKLTVYTLKTCLSSLT